MNSNLLDHCRGQRYIFLASQFNFCWFLVREWGEVDINVGVLAIRSSEEGESENQR